ncbi:MAG: GntR family transcriptional regulator [Methylovulum sp.]|uniref:GntR family transcriptional regulator n=1 Tax=Methylovulum sp. TaxID=1916980 RepID=UPI0026343AD4|nr:GntR family transcriptional regulator [Methylovulum sp.]MDD2724990.1 GntR family transcriptional regulator [Methylovulum sp.]
MNIPHSSAKTILPPKLFDQLKISEQSSEPAYLQLKRQIDALIDNGVLETGHNLPSERVLAEALSVSRTTVKRCYDELRNSQRLSTHGRGGTIVQSPSRVNPTLGKLKGFTEEMREQGKVASSRVLEYGIVSERTIACIFKRPSAAIFLHIIRLRLADNVPMTREVAWYDLSAVPDLEKWDTSGSIYTFLQDTCGIPLVYAEQTIEAVISNEKEAEVFGFDKPEPCLLLKRHSYSASGQLIEYVEGTFRGDAYVYKLKLR